jgi:hypothetical protein
LKRGIAVVVILASSYEIYLPPELSPESGRTLHHICEMARITSLITLRAALSAAATPIGKV